MTNIDCLPIGLAPRAHGATGGGVASLNDAMKSKKPSTNAPQPGAAGGQSLNEAMASRKQGARPKDKGQPTGAGKSLHSCLAPYINHGGRKRRSSNEGTSKVEPVVPRSFNDTS